MAASRLFVGVWLPDTVSGELRQALRPLQQDSPHIAWQPRERWHITLAFLGERDEPRERLRFQRLHPGPLEPLRLSGFGVFGPILWVGVQHEEALSMLAHDVRRLCRVSDGRSFHAHVTVGRARGRAAVAHARDVLSEAPAFASSSWVPDEVYLVRSTVGPHPEYETIARVGLPDGP